MSKEEILCKFIEYDDIENVELLLNQGANPTVITTFGHTAIGVACVKKHSEILERLLRSCLNYQSYGNEREYGESQAKKWKGYDELASSCGQEGDRTPEGMDDLQWEDEISLPQPQRVKEDTVDDEWSVLYRYYASVIEKTGEMLATTISLREPHCLDAFQQAPIHYAATVGSYKCMELLLKHNAPINMTTNTGYTALHLAIEQPKIVELLLQYKANPNKLTFYDQMAPIHMAAKIGIVDTIELLKDAGANVNITTVADQTPLHLAVTFQKYDAAVKLIQCGAKVNLEDEKGLTPLYTAIVVNDYRMAKMLLKHGARLLPSQYLLNYTIRNRMTAMTRLLIKAGENVNGRDYIGWTPLLLAINQRDIEIIEYLLANGAKINRNDYVLKELHIAVQQSSSIDEFRKLFTVLTRHGVDVDSLNKWGETPLCLAMLMEKYQFAELLIKEGVNVNGGCSLKVKDCMLLVRECNNINLIKLFVNAGLKICWPELLTQRISNNRRQQCDMNDTESCETYLTRILTNPMTLKQLSRIELRNRLIRNMKNYQFVNDFVLSRQEWQPQDQSHDTSDLNPSFYVERRNASTESQRNCATSYNGRAKSILKSLICQLEDLPVILHYYLYDFPDVPHVPRDIDIFVND